MRTYNLKDKDGGMYTILLSGTKIIYLTTPYGIYKLLDCFAKDYRREVRLTKEYSTLTGKHDNTHIIALLKRGKQVTADFLRSNNATI